MRIGIGLVLALAASAAGCRALGLYETSSSDMSDQNTPAGKVLKLDSPHQVRVAKFQTNFKTAPGSVDIELMNEGILEDFIAFDIEFGYPAPADSFSPYTPEFIEVAIADWKKGEKFTKNIPGAPGAKQAPLFARILETSGSDVRETAARETPDSGLRRGTQFLGGKIEVVKIEGDLVPVDGKVKLAYTLESTSETEVGNLRYMVQFFKDGKALDLGRRVGSFRPAGKPLGKTGDQVVVEVSMDASGLAGSKPVLRVIQ
jgi:hypothetical protein